MITRRSGYSNEFPKVDIVETGPQLITLDEAKAQLRVTGTAEDAVIGRMLAQAINEAEEYTSRRFRLVTMGFSYASIPAHAIALPYGPVISILGIEAIGPDGSPIELDPEDYTTAPDLSVSIAGAYTWMRGRIVAEVGYVAREDIEEGAAGAILARVNRLYEVRDGGSPADLTTYQAALHPYRLGRLL